MSQARKAYIETLMVNLRTYQRRFENYMTANRWDTCCAGGIYEDEGLVAVACFIEYIERGMVTDGNGKELEA